MQKLEIVTTENDTEKIYSKARRYFIWKFNSNMIVKQGQYRM